MKKIEIKKLNHTNFIDILNYEKSFTDHSLVYKSEEESIKLSLSSTFSLGCFDNDDLIAYILIKEKIPNVLFIEKIFVDSNYRGLSIANELLSKAQEIKSCITAYVSPLNAVSLNLFTKNNFNVIDVINYNGNERLVLHKNNKNE